MTDIVKSGASLLNSVKDSSTSFMGHWEDVKDYSTLIVTLQSPRDGSGMLVWSNTTRRQTPSDDDIISTEQFYYSATSPKTLQWDHRGRWFKLQYMDTSSGPSSYNDFSLNIETLYKGAGTELKIADDNQNVVSLHGQSYQTIYTDISGTPLATTDNQVGDNTSDGEALFVNLRDSSSSFSYAHTDTNGSESLFVGLRDNNNVDLSSTATNDLVVHATDALGYSQATTYDVSGAFTGAKAYYIAGADNTGAAISTTNDHPENTGANALYVHLTLSGGIAIDAEHPLPCSEANKIAQVQYFDVSTGIKETFQSTMDLSSGRINLFNLFTYNDGPVTVWTKCYDMSHGYYETLHASGALVNGSVAPYEFTMPVDICVNPAGIYTATVFQPETVNASAGSGTGAIIEYEITNTDTGGSKLVFTYDTGAETGSGYLNSNDITVLQGGYNYNTGTFNSPLYYGAVTASLGNIITNIILEFDPSEEVNIFNERYNDRVLFNIATPPGQCRDFKFPRGLLFNEGLYFRSTIEHVYDSSAGPGDDILFVNGAYFKSAQISNDFTVNYGSRGDVNFESTQIADVPAFELPEPEPEPLTGLEFLGDEPAPIQKTIGFRADGDNSIEGSVTFTYDTYEELLSLDTMISVSVRPIKEILFSYDEMGNQVQYDIDVSELEIGTSLSTENINITEEQLEGSKITIILDNDLEVNIAYNGV